RRPSSSRNDCSRLTRSGPACATTTAASTWSHSHNDPPETALGLDGWLTRRALEMAVRAGAHEPFRKAESLLRDLAGWSVDADTLRRRCHEQARAVADGRAARAALPGAFAGAAGDCELHIDAGKVFGTDKK